MGQFGTQKGELDTVVLGCTHYPFAKEHLAKLLGPDIRLLDNGEPVARQTRRLIAGAQNTAIQGGLTLLSTGDASTLHRAAAQWLAILSPVDTVLI
jgi:glutamate racemase